MPVKWRALDIVQGYYLGHLSYILHEHGVFDRLIHASLDAASLSDDLGWDRAVTEALLELLYQTTDLLIRDRSGRYSVRARYRGYYQLGFQLDKFIGGYGAAVAHFNGSLKAVRRSGSHFVDRERLAHAFDRASQSGPSIAGHVLRTYGVRTLVDIGCGPAAVLIELGSADAEFRGWGLDASPQMCAVAQRRVASAGLADRVRIHRTDVRRLGRALDAGTRDTIEAIYGGSILNEFFADGSSEVIRILRQLRRQFPGRLLFVQDYYGMLGRQSLITRKFQHALLQDIAQLVSGQGVPPADVEDWAAIYADAECTLREVYVGHADGIAPFVHVVSLTS
jgi:hypothetical protein